MASVEVKIFRKKYSNLVFEPPRVESHGSRLDDVWTPSGTAYDLVEALYSILNLGDNESGPTTYTSDDFDDNKGDLLGEYADK